jgi:hypothetical protein
MARNDSKTYVVVNERGRRIGESHPRARLTDHEIDLIRELAEDEVDAVTGKLIRKGLSYREIAEKFEMECSGAYVSKIVR